MADFYYENYCPCHYKHHKCCMDSEGWSCSLLANQEAVIGTLTLLCNVLAFYFIGRQIRQTNASLKIGEDSVEVARRSINAFVGTERGYLDFYAVRLSDPNFNAKGHYAFKNIGRTPVRIIRVSARGRFIEDIPKAPDFTWGLEGGVELNRWFTKEEEGLGTASNILPYATFDPVVDYVEFLNRTEDGENAIIEICIVFDLAQGGRYRCDGIYRWDVGFKHIAGSPFDTAVMDI